MDDGFPGVPADLVSAVRAALSEPGASRGSADALVELPVSGGVFASRALPRGTVLLYLNDRCFTRRTLGEESEGVWRYAEAVVHGGEVGSDARWALPCESIALLRHTEAPPNVSVVASPERCAVVVLSPLTPGAEARRDVAPGSRTTARAACLLALLPPERWANPGERESLASAYELDTSTPAEPPLPRLSAPEPPQTTLRTPDVPLTLFTDYPTLAQHLRDPRFQLAPEPCGLDALWTMQPLRDFQSLPSGLLVNQFPYEGCLVRKDLLGPITSRLAPSAASGQYGFPEWMPATYDLRTQAHRWRAHHEALLASGGPVTWIVKRATGTHSLDCAVTDIAACVARHALAGDCDRVVQRYICQPACLSWRKFDLRVYVAVRSFLPLHAAMDVRYYARCASAPFSMDASTLSSFDTHFTVSWYDGRTAPPDALLSASQLREAAAAAGWDWAAAEGRLRGALRELLHTAGTAFVGVQPDSRALYGVDVMFTETLQPRILEVNFCGDLATLLHRVPGGAEEFVDDVVAYLLLGEERAALRAL